MKELEKESMIRALAVIKKAIAVANKDYGIKDIIVNAISTACDELINGIIKEENEKIWESEDICLTDKNINEYISERASYILKEEREDSETIGSIDLIKNANEISTLSTAMYVAVALNISESLIPALKKLKYSLKEVFGDMKDIVKVGSIVPMGSEPPTLGDEFIRYISQIDSDINRYQAFLPKFCYLETDGTMAEPDFVEKLASLLLEITGIHFFAASSEEKSQDIHNALVEISGSLNVVGYYLKEMTTDINYFPEIPQYELRDVSIIIKDLEEGSVILRENLVPTHREILVAITTHLAYNHSSIVFAANSYSNYNSSSFKTMIVAHLLRSLKLIIHGINFLTKQLAKATLPTTTGTSRPKTPCSGFGNSQFKKIVQ